MSGDDQAPSVAPGSNAGFEQNVRLVSGDMVSGRLVAAARALLGWGQIELAERAGIRRQTVAEFENEVRRPQARVRDAVLRALDAEGVRFVEVGGAYGVVLNSGVKNA